VPRPDVLTTSARQEGGALRVPLGRRSAVIVALSAAVLSTGLGGHPAHARSRPAGLGAFLDAVGEVETGGRYTARNTASGAYGKYQIMPSNWPAWARKYIGSSKARPTPRNQEIVAAGKMTDLYAWLHQWKRVAYWWLTGSSKASGWGYSATRYVQRVMHEYRHGRHAHHHGKGAGHASPATRHFGERSSTIAYRGGWRSAGHSGYAGDRVRYATRAGATATFTFTGRRVVWYGPTGSTRGQAKVYVDGRYVRTVNLRSRSFTAHDAVFSRSWSRLGRHRLTVVVVGTRGHPMVAIDEFVVRR
jgi:hypothetical protein